MKRFTLVAALALSACDIGSGEVVTLYRNSPVTYSMRIHFATFDSSDGTNYNLSNCQMAARTFNANVTELAKRDGRPRNLGAGFWCEVGRFKEGGRVPFSFREEYPTDA